MPSLPHGDSVSPSIARHIGLILVLLSAASSPAATPSKERVDAFGDPLPPEAVRRIGSIHFRPGGPAHTLIPCPDGKTLISDSAMR